MALFDNKPKPALVRQTDNVAGAIKEIATAHGVPLSFVDFSVQNTITEVKMPTSTQFEELSVATSSMLNNNSLLIDPDFFIRQIHKVTFRINTEKPKPILAVEVSSDKTRTKAYATILPTSTIREFANLREFIINELNKVKLRYSMIINFKEGTFRSDVGNLVNKIRVHGGVTEPFRVQLCEWLAPKATIDDELILHYKNKKMPKENERIDYADRGFINAVEAGDLLVEYVKPKAGVAGRDFRGVHIPVKEPKNQFSPVLSVDDASVDTAIDENSIKYYALTKGFASFSGDNLSVGDVLEVDSIDFKNTGDIKGGIDKDIKISIKAKTHTEDSIGPNSKVEASEIDIAGSVASGAVIRAQKILIKGQTHSTSKIFATEADIGVHRGTLEAETVKIDRLEYGKVNAKEVMITRAIGGFVSARVVTIRALHSHMTIVASQKVVIESLEGGENRIFIEAAAYKEDKTRLKELLEEKKILAKSKIELSNKYKIKRELLERNKTQAEQIKQRIDSEKKAGRVVPSVFVDRYREFLELMKEARSISDDLAAISAKITELDDGINSIQNTVFNAVVVNRGVWINYNEIKFRLISPLKEISFVPPENTKISELKLEQVGLEEYEIRAFV